VKLRWPVRLPPDPVAIVIEGAGASPPSVKENRATQFLASVVIASVITAAGSVVGASLTAPEKQATDCIRVVEQHDAYVSENSNGVEILTSSEPGAGSILSRDVRAVECGINRPALEGSGRPVTMLVANVRRSPSSAELRTRQCQSDGGPLPSPSGEGAAGP
jgi:hypothetical protein